MLNRCLSALQYVGNRCKDAAKAVINGVKKVVYGIRRNTLPAALVAARNGSAVFNILHFGVWLGVLKADDYSMNEEAGYKAQVGYILIVVAGSLFVIGSTGDNVVTRFFNLRRKRSAELAADQQPVDEPRREVIIEEEVPGQPAPARAPSYADLPPPEEPSCCYPGFDTTFGNRVKYTILDTMSYIYWVGSGMSGVMSARSLVTLWGSSTGGGR